MSALHAPELAGLGIRFIFNREARAGAHCAVVRNVRVARGEIRALVVQLAGGKPDAATLSARYRGERVKLEGSELESVQVRRRGRWVSIDELVGGAA